MSDESKSLWGSRIERGVITGKSENGGYAYDVESIDRPGVIAYGLPGDDDMSIGTKVYYFSFEDGKGLVLHQII